MSSKLYSYEGFVAERVHLYKKWMLGLRLSWEDEREKHNSWKRSVPQARGRFHELCFSLSSSHESRKPNIHFL